MRQTVDERLTATLEQRLGESFKQVSERLEQVHKGLGEMQTLAAGVGDLKQVLTNVKTRGTWGEVQLGMLLEQILTPEQYAANVACKLGCAERVEFAIRLPGQPGRDGDEVWLPIDAKFPVEDYQRMLDAQDKGDLAGMDAALKALETRIKASAKDIQTKYLDPPRTTDFAIMFLPTEGLYAEVLRRPGLVESLQSDFRVLVTGPTTLGALLNSLQMGFRILTIEKRSSEVWQLLGAVKTQFGQFGGLLEKVHKKLDQASSTIEDAARKSRTIERRLRTVQELPGRRRRRPSSLLPAAEATSLEARGGTSEPAKPPSTSSLLSFRIVAIDTVIFDLDGVLIETEQEWNDVRREFAARHGGHWDEHDQPAVMGANSMQWAEYMRDKVGVDLSRPGDLRRGRRRPARPLRPASAAHPRRAGGGHRSGGAVPAGRGLLVAPRAHRVLAGAGRAAAVLRGGGLVRRGGRRASRRRTSTWRPACAWARSLRGRRRSRIPPTACGRRPRPGWRSSPSPTRPFRPPPTPSLWRMSCWVRSARLPGISSQSIRGEAGRWSIEKRLNEFLGGERWAVVGASEDRSKFGNITFRELKRRGKKVYPGEPEGRARWRARRRIPASPICPSMSTGCSSWCLPSRARPWCGRPTRPASTACGSSREPSLSPPSPTARLTG